MDSIKDDTLFLILRDDRPIGFETTLKAAQSTVESEIIEIEESLKREKPHKRFFVERSDVGTSITGMTPGNVWNGAMRQLSNVRCVPIRDLDPPPSLPSVSISQPIQIPLREYAPPPAPFADKNLKDTILFSPTIASYKTTDRTVNDRTVNDTVTDLPIEIAPLEEKTEEIRKDDTPEVKGLSEIEELHNSISEDVRGIIDEIETIEREEKESKTPSNDGFLSESPVERPLFYWRHPLYSKYM